MEFRERSAEELLGPLNEVEKKNAPKALYVAGRPELLLRRPRVSIIGSREASAEGLQAAREIAATVVERRGIVVSGLAKGVDTAAHRSAIENRGETIAVIGTPLTRAYPKENEVLQRELMEKHLVVSEFSPEMPTTRKSFLFRNRTMALLSHASVIVEAEESSGTQHQGWEALRLGRLLFLPQALLASPFEWPAKMLHYGALVFDGVSEFGSLLDEFLPSPPPRTKEMSELRF